MHTWHRLHPVADEILTPRAVRLLVDLDRHLGDRIAAVADDIDTSAGSGAPSRAADTCSLLDGLRPGTQPYVADLGYGSPTSWSTVLFGHRNLRDVHRGNLRMETCVGVTELAADHAPLVVRPRSLTAVEHDFTIDGRAVSAGIFDLALAVFHGPGPHADARLVLALPDLDHPTTAELWGEAVTCAETSLGLPSGSVALATAPDTPEVIAASHAAGD